MSSQDDTHPVMPRGFDFDCPTCKELIRDIWAQPENIKEVVHCEDGTHVFVTWDGRELTLDPTPAPNRSGIVPAGGGGPVILDPLVMELTDLDDEEDEEDGGAVLGALMEQETTERETADGEEQDPA